MKIVCIHRRDRPNRKELILSQDWLHPVCFQDAIVMGDSPREVINSCCLSHLMALEKHALGCDHPILILEDDAVIVNRDAYKKSLSTVSDGITSLGSRILSTKDPSFSHTHAMLVNNVTASQINDFRNFAAHARNPEQCYERAFGGVRQTEPLAVDFAPVKSDRLKSIQSPILADLANTQEERNLVNNILRLSDKPLILMRFHDYMKNGDKLIYKSIKDIFDRAEITYQEANFRSAESLQNKHLCIQCTGGFSDLYSVHKSLLDLVPTNNDISILPASAQSHHLRKLHKHKHHIFCRESDTFKELNAEGLNVSRCQDVALMYSKYLTRQEGVGAVSIFRKDAEATGNNYPVTGTHLELNRMGFDDWMKTLDCYREIHTDYLHNAIPAIKLKKKVVFYPGLEPKKITLYKEYLKPMGVMMHTNLRHNDKGDNS